MTIRNLKKIAIANFDGKNTQQNLVDAPPGTMVMAKNVMIQNDQQISKAPGYTQVATLGTGPIRAQHDFTRGVDGAQFVIVQSGDKLYSMAKDGSNVKLLSSGEGSDGFRFVQSTFACYASDGVNAYRFVDIGDGGLTKYNWGIQAPTTAPTIATGSGTLSLQNGRRYVRCYVSRYTDSLGVQRLSISAPSPMSSHTGPLVNEAVTVGGMTASSDPQVNYQWIFATTDSAIDTTATYYFLAEIPNSQTSWGDALTDDSLDLTRIAPYDNNPAPAAPILRTFQNRAVAIDEQLIQLSGYDEITLGIPMESWPLSLFFDLPDGKNATAAIAAQEGTVLLVASPDYWYSYKGYDATTFTEQDKVASPGCVGRDAVCETPFGIVWLSPSKRIWLWNGSTNPTDISSIISNDMYGTYGMNDLSAADLSRAVLKWYSFGCTHFIAMFCRTNDAPDANLNLMQMWSVNVSTMASSGQFGSGSTVYGQIKGIYQTDRIPSVSFTNAAMVEVASEPYIFCGDAAGNVYRLPDGYADASNPMQTAFGVGWIDTGERSKMMFVDVTTNRTDALTAIQLFAKVADSPDPMVPSVPLTTQAVPLNAQTLAIRASLQLEGIAVGRYIAIYGTLPTDSNDAWIREIAVYSKPMFKGIP